MEHAVYVCSWVRTEAGFSVWVVAEPRFRAEGLTVDAAKDALCETILTGGGAVQPVLEFDPPLPVDAARTTFAEPALLLIVGDERLEVDGGPETYFSAPVCRACSGWTQRGSEPLVVASAPSADAGFGMVAGASATLQLLSEAFLDLLTHDERAALELRPVVVRPRSRSGSAPRKKFQELIGPGGAPFCGVAGFSASGWRCERCDRRTFGYWLPDLPFRDFVARSDLPSSLPGVFTVGETPNVKLVVTEARWKQLVGRKGTRGFVSARLGVATDQDVIRRPELPTRGDALTAERAKYDAVRRANAPVIAGLIAKFGRRS